MQYHTADCAIAQTLLVRLPHPGEVMLCTCRQGWVFATSTPPPTLRERIIRALATACERASVWLWARL
jgi:hypothetical protein